MTAKGLIQLAFSHKTSRKKEKLKCTEFELECLGKKAFVSNFVAVCLIVVKSSHHTILKERKHAPGNS